MIQKIRQKAGLTQRQVANELGLTVGTVSNWEARRKHLRLDPPQMVVLCKVLGCSLEELANEFPYPEIVKPFRG